MSTLLLSMCTISISMMCSSSPILFIILIITQTLCICVVMKLFLNSSIFPMILFLIFIGGMMILFSYIVSLTPNNMIKTPLSLMISKKVTMLIIVYTMFLYIIFSLKDNLFKLNTLNKSFSKVLTSIINIYSDSMHVVLMLFFLLFITLIISVFFILFNSGPMRSLTSKTKN